MQKRTNERGAIMVEVIAVLALLGTMGTLLYRQMIRRNEDLENVNLASEMRIMKEALTAYIQADKALLEDPSNCNTPIDDYVVQCNISQIANNISLFVPDGYASTVNSYNFYIYTYILNPDIAPRQVFYGMVFPKGINEDYSPLPGNMNALRAARIASLIGAEGGIYFGGSDDKLVHGTLGGWELDCPEDDDACPNDEPMYAAITGTDIFIPEVEQPQAPTTKVALPYSVAFTRLHGTEYFSVGDNNQNCVQINRVLDQNNQAQNDTIIHPGEQLDNSTSKCDPLFWVGELSPDTENEYKLKSGQVYIKNSLYIGQDYANKRHAVAIERDDSNGNQIRVYDLAGTERLTLNSNGQIIARDNEVKTVHIDGEKGEIALNERNVEIEFDGEKTTIAVPTVIIGSHGIKMDGMTIHNNGLIETKEEAAFYDDNGDLVNTTYRLDPAYTSLMNDIRLTSRGGARLSDILPNYIMQNVSTHQFTNGDNWTVDKPKCPTGYAKAIIVTPTAWSQYVKSATLQLKPAGETEEGSNQENHIHDLKIDEITLDESSVAEDNTKTMTLSDNEDNKLTLSHRGAVVLTIDGTNTDKWTVEAKYEDGPAYKYDPITVMAQTYCVFDKTNFTTGNFNSDMQDNYNYNYDTKAPSAAGVGIMDSNGKKTEYRSSGTITSNECKDNNDCSITSYCKNSVCTEMGAPCEEQEQPDDSAYCVDNQWISISCTADEHCDTENGKKCIGYRCK